MNKYIKLITNRYALFLTVVALLAMLNIMATSDITLAVVVSKVIGFFLVYVFSRLYNKWKKEGKIDCIAELFNDAPQHGEPEEQHHDTD